MGIKAAAALIEQAFLAGKITMDEACRAQAAIRAKTHYGNTMTNARRASLLEHRFGIV